MAAVLAVADRVDGAGVGNLEQARCRTAMQSECVRAAAIDWKCATRDVARVAYWNELPDAHEHSHGPSALALLEAQPLRCSGLEQRSQGNRRRSGVCGQQHCPMAFTE